MTITSLNWLTSSASVIAKVDLPPTATVWLTYPTEVNVSSALELLTLIENAPFPSEVVPTVLPLTTIETPGMP